MGETSSPSMGDFSDLQPRDIPLTISGGQLKETLSMVADSLGAYLDGLPTARVGPHALQDSLKEWILSPPSEGPVPLSQLLPQIQDAVQTGFEGSSPLFLGFFPPGNVVESAIGELIDSICVRHTAYRESGPGTAAFADSIIQWMVKVVGLGDQAHGVLTSGGSHAILSTVIGARERFVQRGGDLARARVYLSDQTHHCIRRALFFAGMPREVIKVVPTSRTRLDPTDMERAIQEDLVAGYHPMLMFAAAGTTNTGNIEPLNDLADLAEQHGIWYHVDGCYGGLFALTARGNTLLKGIDRADSVSLNPYKAGFFPFGVGALLVSDAKAFGQLLSPVEGGEYLRDHKHQPNRDDNNRVHHAVEVSVDRHFSEWPEPTEMSTELTTEARGLRLWLPLNLHGVKVFRDLLDSRLDLAQLFCDHLESLPPVEIPVRPDLGVVVARLKGPQKETDEWLRVLKSSPIFFFSSTEIEGRAVLRISLGNRRMWKEELEVIIGIIKEALVKMGLM